MVVKINFTIAFAASFINGIVTFCKFYNYIQASELFLLIFLRVLITFILFLALGLGTCLFLKQQIPQLFAKSKAKEPAPTKVDYILPALSPNELVEKAIIGESEKNTPDELAKIAPETLASAIRTIMSQE